MQTFEAEEQVAQLGWQFVHNPEVELELGWKVPAGQEESAWQEPLIIREPEGQEVQ